MEKLKIEHLAPYLPYRLKVRKMSDHDSPIADLILDGLSGKGCFLDEGMTHWRFSKCKPLLRPLSELMEDIEFRLDKLIYKSSGDELSYNKYKESTNEIILNSADGSAYYYKLCFEDLNSISYTFILMLIENHFDVFGLIDKGLAVPLTINTNKENT